MLLYLILGMYVKNLINHAVCQLVKLTTHMSESYLIKFPHKLFYMLVDRPKLTIFNLINVSITNIIKRLKDITISPNGPLAAFVNHYQELSHHHEAESLYALVSLCNQYHVPISEPECNLKYDIVAESRELLKTYPLLGVIEQSCWMHDWSNWKDGVCHYIRLVELSINNDKY